MSNSAEIKIIKPWHEELIDFMLAQPRAGGKECADYFGVTQSWISTVKNSDAFQEAWAVRRGQHSSAVTQSLKERVEALAEITVDTMTRKLEKEGESIGLTTLREVSETALKSLGFGAKHTPHGSGGGNVYNGNVVMVDSDTLARAREARRQLQERNASLRIATEFKDHDSAPESANGLGKLLPPPGSGAEAIHTDIEYKHHPPTEFKTKEGETIEHDSIPLRKGPTQLQKDEVERRAKEAGQELVNDFLGQMYINEQAVEGFEEEE